MSRLYLIFCLFLFACNTPEGSFIPESSYSNTSEGLIDLTRPIEATKYVSFHADRTLSRNANCTQIMRFNLIQKKNYADTLTELQNRAALMGGNSVSLIGWKEKGLKTILLSNIFICRSKVYHIHPHPVGY